MQPIFITGCARSGTSLIVRLFDGHPEILPFFGETFVYLNHEWIRKVRDPEQRFLHFAGHPYGYERKALQPRQAPIIRERNWEPHKFWSNLVENADDIDSIERKLKRSLEKGGTREVFETLARMHLQTFWQGTVEPRFIPEKTPRNERFSERMFRDFPGAKLIHMVRDPFDYMASRWRFRDRGRRDRTIQDDVMGWKASLRRGLSAHRRHPDGYRFVKFERLVAETDAVMRKLSDFLAVEFDEAMLAPTELAGKRLWESHTHQDIAVPDGLVDERLLQSDARAVFSDDELAFIGAWVRPEYIACGFSKYREYVDRHPRRFADPHGPGSPMGRLRLLLRIFKWAPIRQISGIQFI